MVVLMNVKVCCVKMEKGVERWMVNISEWNPSPHHFSLALSLLPHHLHSSITMYFRMEDRKRALVSRLLQYALVHGVLGIPYQGILINRTLEGKPYLECSEVNTRFPNFNFNVSHHGDYVVIASEPLCLVGVDVVSCTKPPNETIQEFIQSFKSYFSSLEWNNIINAGTSDKILREFYRYWCLKEAYVKAIGSGLSYQLEKVEFHHANWENISANINGKPMTEWKFWLFELQKNHLVSVARGHPRYAAESYKRTLKKTEFDQAEYMEGFALPNVKFKERTVKQVIKVLNHMLGTCKQKPTLS